MDRVITDNDQVKNIAGCGGNAELIYVTQPTEAELGEITAFVRKKFGCDDITLKLIRDESLISGFQLRVGSSLYDWSQKGRSEQLRDRLEKKKKVSLPNDSDVISVLKSEVDAFKLQAEDQEVGFVKTIGDGIATVSGLDHVQYGEIVIFENGIKAMAQDIRENEIGVILFGDEREIKQGTKVKRTEKRAGIPVGNQFLGRVIDALGAPIDGEGPVKSEGYRPIENEAPGIVDRKQVTVPLQTGILSIDSMFPIGRGQRELIIGDRQTGKTSIALDTIINQKDKNVVCIYVAVGQKASTVAQLANTLKQHEAMSYTCIVNACASDPAPLQYIAPYSGTALAEFFMYQGRDVLIVYDDLSKHAAAYRAISLLLGRPPGRVAYPGDVFYLHSRLLERSSRLTPEAGGGSITALPIIETQYGDISAYIPTNVISITDGQICLESELFNEGMRPAVNVGLSVSRVGGAAQTKAMKKAAGSIRIDLAQFREMQVFTQFSSDLDDSTKDMLKYGNGLMQLLKQPIGHPLSMAEQVVTLCAAMHKAFQDVPVDQVKSTQVKMLDYFNEKKPDIMNAVTIGQQLTPDLEKQITDSADEFVKMFLEEQSEKNKT